MTAIVSKLKKKLKAGDTVERCGLVLASGRVFQTDNVHPEPEKGFEIPIEKMIEFEQELVGTWHTHPGKPATLSEADYDGFRNWPSLTHYIVGADGVRAYRVEDGLCVNV